MPTEDLTLGVTLSEDRSRADIVFRAGDNAVPVTLDAFQVTRLIEGLGRLREGLAPAIVPAIDDKVPAGHGSTVVHGPSWRISGEKLDGNRVVWLRHPCFGWIAWLLPQTTADQLAKWLTIEVDDPFDRPGGRA